MLKGCQHILFPNSAFVSQSRPSIEGPCLYICLFVLTIGPSLIDCWNPSGWLRPVCWYIVLLAPAWPSALMTRVVKRGSGSVVGLEGPPSVYISTTGWWPGLPVSAFSHTLDYIGICLWTTFRPVIWCFDPYFCWCNFTSHVIVGWLGLIAIMASVSQQAFRPRERNVWCTLY